MDPNETLSRDSGEESPKHACVKCGTPTAFNPPTDSVPGYIPIRAPAVNLPPNTNREAIILSPVPQPESIPIISPPHSFFTPSKHIRSPEDIRAFQSSDSGSNFLGFVSALSRSMTGRKISEPCHVSSSVSSIVDFLDSLLRSLPSFPPLQQSSRYGNLAFRSWHDHMVSESHCFMVRLCGDAVDVAAATELAPYFTDSFGNYSRIDYGTGHETNFAAWLYCLARIGLIKEEDYQAVVSRVFTKYLNLMRRLQLDYCLEPAGSHGVWGLDDYHFLPFVFGSAQLIGHKYMKPKSIHNQDILDSFAHEYLYLSCIVYITKMKKGPFAEHSPLLDDISGVPNWNKVNSGLLKMYRAEVLEKVPIMQHFLFGSIIKWE